MKPNVKDLQRVLSSAEIRSTFIEYFQSQHGHRIVRSSPVMPLFDPTLAFVNAGMNQFKSVFLDKCQPPYWRVVNSQKCVRVGGKYNDLDLVGRDGHHHTFFEMLGNWSFGNYFKEEACAMALNLLCGPFNINPARLYVTYFAGDKVLGLPADLECLEIWKSLGFPNSHILPFGCKENFWEMGLTGPCGPCTEIHIDKRPDTVAHSNGSRSYLVNTNQTDLTELWNIVFIQHKRNEDGTITDLPLRHVDTGMGLERLTAILQNKSSNYDTDLFIPILKAIEKVTHVAPYQGKFIASSPIDLDTNYRILADHARMIAICLADGMLPSRNQKLRRVLRKIFMISEKIFATENLLNQLIPIISDVLGNVYPELSHKESSILELINHEREVYQILKRDSSQSFLKIVEEFPQLADVDLDLDCPGLVPAYRDFQSMKTSFVNGIIPGHYLYKLRDSFGLTEDQFMKFAQLENMSCDKQGYWQSVNEAKLRNRGLFNEFDNEYANIRGEGISGLTKHLKPTDTSAKYEYTYDEWRKMYDIRPMRAKIIGLLYNDVSVREVIVEDHCGDGATKHLISVITDVSNFYCESGGQQSDRGHIIVESDFQPFVQLKVINVIQMNGCLIHICQLPPLDTSFTLAVNADIILQVDAKHRLANTCHHTATHLLNAAIRTLYKKYTYQISSTVTNENCKLELGLIGQKITKEQVREIEELVNEVINLNVPITVSVCDSIDLCQQTDVITVPGEIYPDTDLRLVTINCQNQNKTILLSKELCCGTHATNTIELEHFCVINVKQTSRTSYIFIAVAGETANQVRNVGSLLQHRIEMLAKIIDQSNGINEAAITELQQIRHNIIHMNIVLPYILKSVTLDRVNTILKSLKEIARSICKEAIEMDLRLLLQQRPSEEYPFILHYIGDLTSVEEIPLQRATRLCTDRPILVIGVSGGIVKARCCVPKECQLNSFTAFNWLREFADVFKCQVLVPKGYNAVDVCQMRGRKITADFAEQLTQAMQRAYDFAAKHLM